MANADVAVIDYGVGNLLSVRRAFEHCDATVSVTADPEAILAAPRVVLPGVGAFANGMGALERRQLAGIVREVSARGRSLLGICLGMQMLFDESTEFGVTAGLGLIAGTVVAVPSTTSDGRTQKIPHIGWNALVLPAARPSWSGTLLQDLLPGEAAYFVHSFMASPTDSRHRVADCLYGGNPIAAVVARDNVVGCQFHPEKSGEAGLKMLRRFLRM
jgi:imidazole glycerol-phosphate synthase subunit HisH